MSYDRLSRYDTANSIMPLLEMKFGRRVPDMGVDWLSQHIPYLASAYRYSGPIVVQMTSTKAACI